jgi:hypothetical protein
MPKTQFSTPAVETEPEQNTSTALSKPLPEIPQFSGDWDYNDTRKPRINLIHKTSDSNMIEEFGIGSFVFNKEVKLSDGKTPIIVTAMRAGKDFIQKLPFGDPEMPRIYKTREEVLDAGGSFNKKDAATRNQYIPRAHIQFVVEMPEGTDEDDQSMFPYEFNGKQYGMAILTVSSSGYTSTAVELATLCNFNSVMRNGAHYGKLELTSKDMKSTKYSWKVPALKYAGANDPAFVKFVEGLM